MVSAHRLSEPGRNTVCLFERGALLKGSRFEFLPAGKMEVPKPRRNHPAMA